MKLVFDSIEEVQEFVKRLKGSRGGKGGDKDDGAEAGPVSVPPPAQPPTGGAAGFPTAGVPGFAPPAGGATAPGPGFPAPAASPSPEVSALVQRIGVRIDQANAQGQASADAAVTWFRNQLGPVLGTEVASATMDQIKTVLLPKTPVATLQQIAQLMNA